MDDRTCQDNKENKTRWQTEQPMKIEIGEKATPGGKTTMVDTDQKEKENVSSCK
jgi:hypothetical protein